MNHIFPGGLERRGRELLRGGGFHDAEIYFRRALEGGHVQPEFVNALLGRALLAQKKIDEAEKVFETALTEAQGRNKPRAAAIAAGYLGYIFLEHRGAERHLRGEQLLSRAVTVFAQDPQKDPVGYPALESYWGQYLVQKERYAEAEKVLRSLVAREKISAVMWNNLGVCLFAQGKDAEAQASWNEAIKLDADGPVPFFHLAELYLKHGYIEQTEEYWHQAQQRFRHNRDESYDEKLRELSMKISWARQQAAAVPAAAAH